MRQSLGLASVSCELRSATAPIASDYLVPLPSWRSHRQQQPVNFRPQGTRSLEGNYETTLSYGHEYEEVTDVLEEGSDQTCTYDKDRPVKMQMKRNAAYRMYSMSDSEESVRRHAYCNDVIVPNPLNCLYTNLHGQTEESNLE